MAMILLIRHGENDYVKKGRLAGRLPGVNLNSNGRAQAHTLAERLSSVRIKSIYSSPLERALETADPIAKILGLEVVVRPGLIEVDVGDWQNKTLKGLSRRKLWRVVQEAPSRMKFPGGESFLEAQMRIYEELNELATNHKEKDIFICVSHSDPIKLAIAYFLGLPLDMFQRLHISPASISTLILNEHYTRFININYDLSYPLPHA